MYSEEESSIQSIQQPQPKPRKLPPAKLIKPKPRQNAAKAKPNRISSPEIQSVSNSDTSDRTSIEMDVFLARAKTHRAKGPKIATSDISEISNVNTISDDLITETSEEPHAGKSASGDSRSYRDKLKERFRSLKQQSSQSLSKQSNSLKQFRHSGEDVITLKKCIESLRNDNQNINKLLKSHNRYEYIGISGLEVSSAEKYQFFCESLPEKLVTPTELGREKAEFEDNADEENTEPTEEQESYKEKEEFVVAVDKRAENIKKLLMESYEEHVWMPKKKNLIFECETTSRNIQDEGLFITKPPNMLPSHLYQLKQRLLASENKNWFDSSGNIKFNESNYSGFCYRPDGFDSEESSSFDLVYQKASLTIPSDITEVSVAKIAPNLEINIQGLRFTQHPLFSPEHQLQESLIHHFDKHKEFLRSQKREKLFERLLTLRKTRKDLMDVQQAAGDNTIDDSSFLIKQITNIRQEYYSECLAYRDNVKDVLNAWKSLKQLRKDNGYSNTTIKLVINKQEKKFSDDLNQVYEEFAFEKQNEYLKKLALYKEELREWKKTRTTGEDDIIEEGLDKPLKPPRVLSAKQLRTKVKQNYEDAFGLDSEPTITFSVNYSHIVTPMDELSQEEEKQRRMSVDNKKLYLKLCYEGISICKSKSSKMNANFTLNWDECLSLKLNMSGHNPNEKLTVQLVEQQGLSKTILCLIDLAIPKKTQIIGHNNFQELQFDVGKDIDNLNRSKSKISGFLTYCIGWNTTYEIKSPPQDILTQLMNSDGTLDLENLNAWIEANDPDPEDPRNSVIFDYLKEHQGKTTANRRNPKYFRCDPYLEPFTICGKEQIEDNIRLQLLQLRDRNEPEFIGMIIPNRLKEIPTNIFSSYKRRLAEEKYQEYFDEEDGVDDDIVTKRSLGRKYLRQIHTKVFQICRKCENNLCFEDVVNEKMVAWLQNYLKTSLSNFLNWFRFQPAINKPLPLLVATKENEITNCNWNKVSAKLMIQLKGGSNLPKQGTNSDSKSTSSRKASGKSRTSSAESNISGVRFGKYYVEVSYENVKVCSSLTTGKDPLWNETLSIPLNSANIDYLNPHALNGVIGINLYQQFEDEKNLTTDVYVGGVDVPLSATVSEYKLEGHFALKVPPLIFGYEKEEEPRVPSTPRVQHNKSLSFLEMSIYAETTIQKISADLGSISSSEPPYLRDHILEWNKRFNADHPKRKFSALAIDSNGKTTCATRFIKLLEPPQLNSDGFDVTPEQCARYVTLIPFSNANKFYENVWLSAEQTLKLGIGSLTDHATLLTCYLLSLNLEAWLLLGFGIPNGHTAYVLIREYNDTPLPDHYIIDVTNGIKYNITDVYCPLKKVYCVINENNIWGNTQRGDVVFTTRFDFTRRFDWQALFNNTISAPSNSIQQTLHYISNSNTQKLQTAIEKKLIKRFMKLRTQDATVWNHYLSNLLKTQLSKTEKNYMHGKTQIAMTNNLIEFINNYKINGTIQCMTFDSINEVVDKVLRTKIFLHVGKHIEFATSVQVNAYNNQVIAVWVAIMSAIKKYNN